MSKDVIVKILKTLKVLSTVAGAIFFEIWQLSLNIDFTQVEQLIAFILLIIGVPEIVRQTVGRASRHYVKRSGD